VLDRQSESSSAPTALDPLALFRLDGQVAVVTGASSGLGARFAQLLHATGATVVVAARRGDRLNSLVSELPGSFAVAADLSVADDRERLIAATIDRFGSVHVLVNNAGLANTVPIEHEEVEQFREAMELNVTAVWHLSKLASVPMIHQGYGSIVNIASMLGHVGSSPVKQANYCASKGAVVNLTRELALQFARKGIHVNSLSPGWFESEMTAGMESDAGSQRFIKQNSPIPRMGEPHELDGAFLLLASRASTFMTGQSIVVDGGWTAR
jgi:NAD(P)-dependent dehydrogenase (short-subunit alcohol dehydrogenase family)